MRRVHRLSLACAALGCVSSVVAQIVAPASLGGGYAASASLAELAMGDVQLKQAFEAAFSAALAAGAWTSTVAKDVSLVRSESCLPATYAFPSPPVGALHAVLAAGTLRAAVVLPAATMYTPDGLVWLSAAGNAGLALDFYSQVATQLGSAYSRSYLTLSTLTFTSTQQAVDALYAGVVDVVLGVSSSIDTYRGVHEGNTVVLSPCTPYIAASPVFVQASDARMSNVSTLRSLVSSTLTQLQAGVLSSASASTLAGLLQLSNTTTPQLAPVMYTSPADLFAALTAGDIDFAFPGAYFSNNVTGTSSNVRLLTGSLGYMSLPTLLRYPLPQGAPVARSVPSTAGLTMLPPPASLAAVAPEAAGDLQLRAALAAATNRIIRNGDWAQAWAPAADASIAPLETCAGNPAAFPFPPAAGAVGAFASMLSTRVLRAGYYFGTNLTAYNGATLSGTTPDGRVFGMGATYMDNLAAALTAAYPDASAGPITVRWSVAYASGSVSAINNIYSLLTSGAADVLAPTLLVGGEFNGSIPRVSALDAQNCNTYAVSTVMFVRNSESRFTDVRTLLQYLNAGNTLRVAAQTPASAQSAASLLGPNAQVTVVAASATAFEQLTATTPTYDLVYRSTPPASALPLIKRVDGSISFAVYAMFMRAVSLSTNATLPMSVTPGMQAAASAVTCANVPPASSWAEIKSDAGTVTGLAVVLAIVAAALIGLALWCAVRSRACCAKSAVSGTPHRARGSTPLPRPSVQTNPMMVSNEDAAAP